jgi:predicted DNA-binding transcriptional regulator YafY
VFRVDRISELDVSEEIDTFTKPIGFNVKSLMDVQPWEAGPDPEVEANIRFDADVAWWAARTLGLDRPEGDLVANVPVTNRNALVGWVLSFGESAEVLGPQEIRDEISGRVKAALESLP